METSALDPSSPIVARYWPELNALSENVKMELIIMLSRSLKIHSVDENPSHWADRFCGVWNDNRTADEIVDDIRGMRTINSFDVEL